MIEVLVGVGSLILELDFFDFLIAVGLITIWTVAGILSLMTLYLIIGAWTAGSTTWIHILNVIVSFGSYAYSVWADGTDCDSAYATTLDLNDISCDPNAVPPPPPPGGGFF